VTTLYVIRHGECMHNVEGWIAAQNDSPLTERGIAQARANGLLLKKIAGDLAQLDFFASSLHRTCATMELVREAAGLTATGYCADRRLMEIDFGDDTGKSIAELQASPQGRFGSDHWDYVRPNGESMAVVYDRAVQFLGTLTRDAVLVTHAGVARMIRAHVLSLSHEAALAYHPPNAGIMRLSAGTETYFGE
jgi:broad specificity phosphatase PhoE